MPAYYLLMFVYLCVCVCLHVCLSSVCLSVRLSIGGLPGGRSVCLPFSWSFCMWSICLCACLRASVCLHLSVCMLSVYLSIYLSICLYAVGRSQLSAGQSRCARSVQAAEGEDAESESGRLRTQERKTGLMNVELRSKDGG